MEHKSLKFIMGFALLELTKGITNDLVDSKRKGSNLKEMFSSSPVSVGALDLFLKQKPPASTKPSNVVSINRDVTMRIQSCSPDASPWIEKTGFCVPTNLLKVFCNELEFGWSTDDCRDNNGQWCCYSTSISPGLGSPSQ